MVKPGRGRKRRAAPKPFPKNLIHLEACLEIVGVDFSGAKSDDRTWMARSTLNQRGLALHECRPIRRTELAEILAALPGGSVAALDFPFSVPQAFAHFWQPEATTMPHLWAAAAKMELARFLALRDEFVSRCGELKRRCDNRFPESYSCLHKANPNLVPMTFYGMQMLDPLWRVGCNVPPLPSRETGRAVLLEAMPGAALKALNLPYKGYKRGSSAQLLRQRILGGLEERSGVTIRNLSQFRDWCLLSDDCLDAIVAAVVACLWATAPSVFWRPSLEGSWVESGGSDAVAVQEGWMYAPVFLRSPSS